MNSEFKYKSDHSKFIIDEDTEKNAAANFAFYPCEPVTVLELYMDLKDELNMYVLIRLSNGDQVEFITKEKEGEIDEVSFDVIYKVNGKAIDGGEDFVDNYLGINSLVTDMLNYYETFKF